MAEEKAPGYIRGWIKAGITSIMGLCSGAVLMYVSPLVTTAIKPGKPLANFSEHVEGLTVTFQNRATGASDGWWDFGDGSPLEPFAATQEAIIHTFPRASSYNVKLSLRNFLGEENDRTVPVNLEGTSKTPLRSSKPSTSNRSNPMPPRRRPSRSRPRSRMPICASGPWAMIAPWTSAATRPPTRSVTSLIREPDAPIPCAGRRRRRQATGGEIRVHYCRRRQQHRSRGQPASHLPGCSCRARAQTGEHAHVLSP